MNIPTGNLLYYGDNLNILRRYVADESIDLVYLDPPFNSNATYNVLFKDQKGQQSSSQQEAFKDTWTWEEASHWYFETVQSGGKPSQALQAFRTLVGDGQMLAYLSMMAPRLVELRRVLKPAGSIYLHCDPTASHYLKLLMDSIFSARYYRNEIVWKRTSARSDSHRWNHIHDVILFYTKSDSYTWNPQFTEYDQEYLASAYRSVEPGTGRRFTLSDLMAAGLRNGESGKPWRGIDPASRGNHWKYTVGRLDELDEAGRIVWPQKAGGVPRYKRYLDEMSGLAIQSIITDIFPLSSQSAEKLGYPTQKPVSLLERIVRASSNEGDTVLDPFCGCGTTIHAAQALKRYWIGIDITYAAMALIKKRLKDAFIDQAPFELRGEPKSIADAEMLAKENPYQFQWWALDLVGARPAEEKKGADKGIDGRLYFHDDPSTGDTKQIIFSVKAGALHAPYIRDLGHVVSREEAHMGVLLTMQEPTGPMKAEAASAGNYHSPLWGDFPRLQIITVSQLLSGQKLAMPPITQVNQTFKKAAREKGPKAVQKSLIFTEEP